MKQLTPEQLERLKPESREKYEKRLRAVKRNRSILAVVCTVIVAVAVGCGLSMTVLFNINDITVSKAGAYYTAEEIVNASGLNEGDNMVLTDFKQAADRIQTNLPYVLEAQITKKLSGKVNINIKDAAAAILIELNEGYAIADIRGKILEVVEEKPEGTNFLTLKTKNSVDAVPGMFFSFASEQEETLYNKLADELSNIGVFEKITAIDISDYTSVKVEYQNRLRLLLGTTEELDVKLKGCLEVIKTEDQKDPSLVAEINCTIPKKVYVNPIDSLHPEDEIADEDAAAEGEPTSDADTENTADKTDEAQSTTGNSQQTTTQLSEENEDD